MPFPTEPIPRASGSDETIIIPLVKSESEGAYTKVRRKITKVKNEFKLNYRKITKAEYTILKNYFIANQGLEFQFVHPDTLEEYTCIFKQDKLVKTHTDGVLVSTEIMLEEV